MYGPWDAPREFQRSLLEEGDPPPVEAIEPPDFRVTDRDDPDTAFRYACAYAAQAIILDTCWDGLMEAVAAAGSERDWLIMLIGVRGFPLGEHDQVGGIDQRLYAEQLHVPWLIRFPDGRARLTRSARLVTHVDLLPTLAMYKEASSGHPAGATATGSSPPCVSTQSMDGMSLLPIAQGSTAPRRDGLISAAPAGNRALRTDCWSYRQGAPSDSIMGGGEELFVRPDDRWEANDVATRCRDVAKGLDQVIDELCRQIAKDGPMPACELADELRG
jgi:arylsulfatase A-like enzyme